MLREFLISLLLITVTFATFSQILNHEFVNYDDDEYVTNNGHVQSGFTRDNLVWAFTTTHASNWHPLTWLSHMVDCSLYGLNPRGHHLTNLLLHIANTLLLFWALRWMTGVVWQSFFVAALFALHPLHIESVAWVAERKDVLSTCFWMITMVTYYRYTDSPNVGRYLMVVGVFALGLMAKPMLVTLPFVLLLLDFWPLKRFRISRLPIIAPEADGGHSKHLPGRGPSPLPFLYEKIPFFVLSVASSVVTLVAQHKSGAISSLAHVPITLRISNGLVSYVAYIGKMVWPYKLAVMYPLPPAIPGWQVVGSTLLLACISVMALRKANQYPYLIVGWLWYLGTLVPVIGLVTVGLQSMADRYTYVPLIGLFIMIAWGIPDLLQGSRHRRFAISITAGMVLLGLATCTWWQLGHWKNSVTLFQRSLDLTSGSYVIHNNLGLALAKRGRLDEAMGHYAEALKNNPDLMAVAEVHNNMGIALAKQGRLNEGVVHFSEALKLTPGYAKAHNNMGIALAKQGRLNEAVFHFSEALKSDPEYAGAHNNLGLVLMSQGNFNESVSHFSEALRLEPYYAEAHSNLGVALEREGKMDEAISHYTEALRIDPDYGKALRNLGFALAKQGRLGETITLFSEALKKNPNSAELHNSLGIALAQEGRLKEAISHFSEALRLKPDYMEAEMNLGRVKNMKANRMTD